MSGTFASERPPTEHGHVLLAVETPVAPVGPVAVQCGVLLQVVGRLRAKRVNHPDVAPGGEGDKIKAQPAFQTDYFLLFLNK